VRHRLAAAIVTTFTIGLGAASRMPPQAPLAGQPGAARGAAAPQGAAQGSQTAGATRLDRVIDDGAQPPDGRLGAPFDLDHPFTFSPRFETKEAWLARASELRQQIQVSLGLWPMPERTPLNPVIHGKIDRDDYTIEKVFFASYPGHYVSGNLYRPRRAPADGSAKRPAVLSPHGHWENGRLMLRTDAQAQEQVNKGAETTLDGGRSPQQARLAMLARLGFIVFQWDMVGYADSQQIAHREGFTDADAELRQQNFMGLQAWNSLRALDFISSLPDVDATRIAVTGESGGATQTLILDALDDRPVVAFPAVMVSGAMQGGCVCENASLLRVGTNNIELAALFAPKPLGMSAANDWTKDLLTLGLPELKRVYGLFGAEDKVAGRHYPFEHNYNQLSRQQMYDWFNAQLKLGLASPIAEKPFTLVTPAELSVYDAAHPRPKDATDAAGLRRYLTRASDRQLNALAAKPAAYRDTVRAALRGMVVDRLPSMPIVPREGSFRSLKGDGFDVHQALLTRPDSGDALPAAALLPGGWKNGAIVIWAHPSGKTTMFERDGRTPVAAARELLNKGVGVLSADLFLSGELAPAGASAGTTSGTAAGSGAPVVKDQEKFAGYNYGYNRSVLANRVHDLLTLIKFAQDRQPSAIHIVAFDRAGLPAMLALGLAGGAVSRASLDLAGVDFTQVKTTMDELMLPGAMKYGGVNGLLPLVDGGRTEVYRLAAAPAGRVFPATPGVAVRAGAPSADVMIRFLLSGEAPRASALKGRTK
jgi:hypothetical protein